MVIQIESHQIKNAQDFRYRQIPFGAELVYHLVQLVLECVSLLEAVVIHDASSSSHSQYNLSPLDELQLRHEATRFEGICPPPLLSGVTCSIVLVDLESGITHQ